MQASQKQRAIAFARRLGLVPLLERMKYLSAVSKTSSANAAYLRDNPDFDPLPLWWMHDMYSHVSFELYMRTGRETASGISSRIDKYTSLSAPRVADWGCGLARVLRHLPAHYRLYGFDYNPKAITWCEEHIDGAQFNVNGLRPPLPAADCSFDALFALSVSTHLSPQGHAIWIEEISRVLAAGGIFLGAFHTSLARDQLLRGERSRFESGELVTRRGVSEGGRTYVAYHPESYVRSALTPWFDVIEGPTPFLGQSLFVARKR
jgi:SAM-dependent methyltransferase